MTNRQWQMTEWVNPSKHFVELRIFVGPGNTQVYKIPPGGRTVISEEYDESIRTTRDGVAIGGLCPWLQKTSEVAEPPKLATALTPVDRMGPPEGDAEPVESVEAPKAPVEPVEPSKPAALAPLPVYTPPVDEPTPSPKKK